MPCASSLEFSHPVCVSSLLWIGGSPSGLASHSGKSPAAPQGHYTWNLFPPENSIGFPTWVFMTLLLMVSRSGRRGGQLKRKELSKNRKSHRFLTLEKGGCPRRAAMGMVLPSLLFVLEQSHHPCDDTRHCDMSFHTVCESPTQQRDCLVILPHSSAGSLYWCSC